jgi:uncharacterized protein Yka (UPF0111/DUF47 family)
VAPDVVHLLATQGERSLEAMHAFVAWSSTGSPEALDSIRSLDQAAYDARRSLLAALRSALATPVDQEDLYVLSERCDRVVKACKNLAAEADSLAWQPDSYAATMAGCLAEAMGHLLEGFRNLAKDPDLAGSCADRAGSKAHEVVRVYREAMRAILGTGDLDRAFTGREIYRSYARAAELVTAVGDRLWYAVIAEA